MKVSQQARPLGARILAVGWKILRVLLAVVGSVIALVVFAVLFCLDLPAVRRLVASKVDGILATTFAGRITIERLEHLSLMGLSGARVRIVDPDGVQVLLVDDARVRVSALAVAKSALLGKGDLVIDISDVRVAYIDANLDADAAGNLRIARALEVRDKTPAEPGGRGTAIALPSLSASHIWVHGQPAAGSPLLDAEIDHLRASVVSAPNDLRADVNEMVLITRNMPSGADLHVNIGAHYAAPGKDGVDKSAAVDVRGDVGGIPTNLHGTMEGQRIAATLDVPRVAADRVRALSESAPLHADLALHGEASGVLPDIDTRVHASVGDGTIDVSGHVKTGEQTTIHQVVEVKNLDLRSFSPTAPASTLAATLAANASIGGGKVTGDYRLDVPASVIIGQPTPATTLRGTFATISGEAGARASVQGTGHIDEAGAPIDLRYGFEQGRTASTATFDVTSNVKDLGSTRVGAAVSGQASLRAYGRVVLGAVPQVDANLELRAAKLVQGEQQVGSAWFTAHVGGTSDDPRIDALFQGHDVTASGMKFSNVSVTTHGSLRSSDVTVALAPVDGPTVHGRATVETGGATSVKNASFTVARDRVRALVKVSSVELRGSELRVDGLVVEGLGDPLRVEARKRGDRVQVRASSNEIDLAKIATLLHSQDLHGGHLAVDVDLDVRPKGGTGHARIDLTQGAMAPRVTNASAHVDAELDGRRLTGSVHARLAEVGNVDIDSMSVEVGGTGPIASSLGRAWGKMAITSDIDVSRIRSILPRGSLPFQEMQGRVRFSGEIARASETDGSPTFAISAETIGLVLSGRGEREMIGDTRVLDAPPWRLEGVDLQIAAQHDPDKGMTSIHSRAFDKQGTFVSLDASAERLPFAEWMHGKGMGIDRVKDLPISLELSVPRREIKKLPPFLKTQEIGGSVAAKLNVDGSLADPKIRLAADTDGFKSAILPVARPLNAKVGGSFGNAGGKLTVDVSSTAGESLKLESEITGEFGRMLAQKGSEAPPWEATTRVQMSSFPLESLAILSDVQVKGRVSGELSLAGLHRDARLDGHLDLQNLQLGRVTYPTSTVELTYDGHTMRGGVHLQQTDGFLDAKAQLGMSWGAELAPTPNSNEAAIIGLTAKQLRAAAFLPFARSVLSQLDGRIDADARIEIQPGGGAPRMGGTVVYQQGKFQLARVGEQFHDATAKVIVTPDGVIRLEDTVAYGSTGKIMVSGNARLNGFQLLGANAAIRIPRRNPFPVDVDGQQIGDIDGDINIRVTAAPERQSMNIDVEIPTLHTELPRSPTNSVQELSEADRIRVGHFRRQRMFVLLPLNAKDYKGDDGETEAAKASETTVAIHLGNDVEVKKGKLLRVLLTGNPILHITDKARMTGQINLTRGTLNVQGKRFEIERGTVTFVGDDPSNPQVVISAAWPAPDGTRVYADFVGPLKTGKVSLRSEPARPQSEILALIMFGTADGASQTPYKNPNQTSTGTQAATAAGGLATEGLDEGLNDLTGLDVATKLDTSNTGQPTPEIEVQISRDISLQVSYVLGQPPPTNPDKTLVTADWRFKRNWSIAATQGTAGTSILDLIWQYRY